MLRATALSGNEDQRMDQEVLDRIINHLHKYRPADGNQFAMAISIPAEYCDGKSKLDFHFLNRDNPYEVKDETTRLHLYEGVDMIVATPRDDGKGNKLHSEHLLLNHPDTEQSPMKGLLDMDKDSAVIFYTYNSPCKHTCLNEDVDRNILKSLRMFKQHRGPKAFVYNQVFRGDDEDLEEHLGKINEYVPVYRCSTRTDIATPNPYMNYYINQPSLHPDRARYSFNSDCLDFPNQKP